MKSRFLAVAFPIAVLAVTTCPANLYAQGHVLFNTHVVGVVISHIYLPSSTSPSAVQIGNGPLDFPSGNADWTGWTPVTGDGFTAQLFAAPGADAPVDSLTPAFPSTTFLTGPAAGFVRGVTTTMTDVPLGTSVATIQVRVWDNKAGAITDWATALGQPAGTEILGMSAPINVGPIPGPLDSAPLIGLQSFNLAYNVPEPSPLALAGLGALLLWATQSRKNQKI